MTVYGPDASGYYKAAWLRDFVMMLEGDAIPHDHIVSNVLRFVSGVSEDGHGVDCIKADGTCVYKPGYGTMGANAVVDGAPYTIDCVYFGWKLTDDRRLLAAHVVDVLEKALRAMPCDPVTGLVWINPSVEWDRCAWGFTDTVRKSGCCLMESLLLAEACERLAEIEDVVGRADAARKNRVRAEKIVRQADETFWDDVVGLYRAATVRNREHDVWASAFAVWKGYASPGHADAIARAFRDRYDDFVRDGQVRHLPVGEYWELACKRDMYQNGGYWGTPAGWFAWTLSRIDVAKAERMLQNLRTTYERGGAVEWSFGAVKSKASSYPAGLTLPLAAIRRLKGDLPTGAIEAPEFCADERTVFYGDSITRQGWYTGYFKLGWDRAHTGEALDVVNGGVSGDTTEGALSRFDWDLRKLKPDHVVILFGMNDVCLPLYATNRPPSEATHTEREKRIAAYGENLRALVRRMKSEGWRVTLMTPTPYDEYTPGKIPVAVCANEAGLMQCAEIVRRTAHETGVGLVDLHRPLTEKWRTAGAGMTVDRVHPTEAGAREVAAEMLRQCGVAQPDLMPSGDNYRRMRDWVSAESAKRIIPQVRMQITRRGGDPDNRENFEKTASVWLKEVAKTDKGNLGYFRNIVDYYRQHNTTFADEPPRPKPNAATLKRLTDGDTVIGIVHFTVNTFTDREWGYGSEDPKVFNPTDFDAEQIVGACADGGVRGLVVVAKHHDGFCLWPTKTTEHNISKSPFRGGKGDYLKEMSEACRKFGVKFGVYCSPWDRNNAEYGRPRYVETYHEQIRELTGGAYGPVFELWLDGANGGDGYYGGAWERRSIADGYYRFEDIVKFVRGHNPDLTVFGFGGEFVWPGNEHGIVDSNSGCTRGAKFAPYEADFPLRPGWFYHPSQDGYSRSGEFLMKVYLRTVGNAATMNIGISPDRRGRMPDEDVRSLRRFAELKRIFFTEEVTLAGQPFNLVVMEEDVRDGECVDAWRLALDGREIAKGGKIGFRRIRTFAKPVSGEDLKLEVLAGSARSDGVKMRRYIVDPKLLGKVLSASEPKQPPAPFELRGVLSVKRPDALTFTVKHVRTIRALLLTPDRDRLGGTPVVFRLAYSSDGREWTEDKAEYRLDNVAANPVAQRVDLARKVQVKYVRLTVLRTLVDGEPVSLGELQLVP